MLHKIIDQLIKTFGREVLEQWVPLDRLSITSIADPELTLTNIPLPDKLFESPSIPFVPIRSNVGSVVVKCPWKAFLNNDGNVALTVEIRNLDAVLRFKRLNEWNTEHVKDLLLSMRNVLLRKWNSLASSLGLLSASKSAKGSKGVALVNSIDITIHNLKVVLVDNLLYEEPFSITVEAERLHGVSMRPDDPNLNEVEQQGVEKSMLAALWFSSSVVHVWHSVYYQDAGGMGEKDVPFGKRGEPFGNSGFKPRRKKNAARKDVEESPRSDSSHSSDELFDDVEPGMGPDVPYDGDGTRLWNLCTAPCRNLGEHEWTEMLIQQVKPEDEALIRILRGPYKNCNITPPRGVRFDLIFKNWNLSAFSALENMDKQKRKIIQLSFSAVGGDTKEVGIHAPCFNGKNHFMPFDVMLTSAGAEILYNIIRYMQLLSAFRELASENINAMPKVEDCQRYISITSSMLWKHMEDDAKFVEEFERTVPFHILLKIKHLVHSSQKRRATEHPCFISTCCCEQGASEDVEQEYREVKGLPTYDWYEKESMIRIVFANVNLCIVPIERAQGDGSVLSTMLQFSTFAFQSDALYKRATYRILACKPIIRLGFVNVRFKKRTFSARLLLRPDRTSETLLCYPEQMFTQPCEFFNNYGSDELEVAFYDTTHEEDTALRINIERYTDNIKHVHVLVPKVVAFFNVLAKLDSILGDYFWEMNYLTLEKFIERNERYGHSNKEVALKMISYMEVTSSCTLCRVDLKGAMLRVLVQNGLQLKYAMGLDVDGIDKQSRAQQQNVLDWFLLNDKVLNTWQYCEDIDDPFAFKRPDLRNRDDPEAIGREGMPNTVYCKENFVAELDAKLSKQSASSTFVLVPGGDSKFSVSSNALRYLATLRKWYRNTCTVEIPKEWVEDLGDIHSITVVVKKTLVTRDSLTELTYCAIEDASVTSLDADGKAVADIVTIGALHVLKRLHAVCIEVQNIDAVLDTKLPVCKMILRHRAIIEIYVDRLIELGDRLKNLTDFEQRHVYGVITLTGNADVCKIIQKEFYVASPDVTDDCSSDLLDAFERKLHSVSGEKKVVFISAAALMVNLMGEGTLYEAMLYKVQVEVQGKERVMVCLGNTVIYTVRDDTRHTILSCKPSELGKEDVVTLEEVNMDNGQVVIDFAEGQSRTVNVEVRNVHHMFDMQFVMCITEMVKQLKIVSSHGTPRTHGQSVTCNLMVHHSSVHYDGIGAMIDIYAVVDKTESEFEQCLSVKVPRYHATFTKELTKRVFALSLLDVNFEMKTYNNLHGQITDAVINLEQLPEDGAKIVNVLFEVLHCAVWGFHDVTEDIELKREFEDVNSAAEGLEMLLHEAWFNHMTPATLPSCYDETPVVLIPLVYAQYSDVARLTPMLNQTWINDWLIAAARTVEPHLCDGAAAKVLKVFPKEALGQQKRTSIKATISAVVYDDAIISMGDVELVSLGVFLHCESVMHLMDLLSRCRMIMNRPKSSNGVKRMAKLLKINLNMERIDIISSWDVNINCTNTMPSSLLPTTIADTPLPKKRPLVPCSRFYILCIYRLQRIYLATVAETSIVLQTDVTLHLVNTLYNRIENLQELKHYTLFDHTDVLDDVKYQATLHFFDMHYKQGRGNIISVHCSKLQATVYSTLDRFDYWSDIVNRLAADDEVEVPPFMKDFKVVLQVDVTNLNTDLCLASKSMYATKVSIQQINIVDAWGRYIMEDLYNSRCAMINMGNLDESVFGSSTDQVVICLTVVEDVINIKVAMEHTRSEIQIDGISVLAGVLQDLGLFQLRLKDKDSAENKRRVKLDLSLNLHELWFYPTMKNDDFNTDILQSERSVLIDSQDVYRDVKDTIPYVLKTAKEVEYRLEVASAKVWDSDDQADVYNGNVIGCMISLSVSSSKVGNSVVKLGYMGVTLGNVKMVHGVKVLLDERNDFIFNTLDADERMLFEVRESTLKSKMLENGHLIIGFQASKPNLSVNVDQLFQVCLLKPSIVDAAITTLKAHRAIIKGKEAPISQVDLPVVNTHDLIEEIKSVAQKFDLPMVDLSNMQGSVYNVPPDVAERNRLALQGRERGSKILNKVIGCINRLIWKDGDKQMSFSLVLNDCKCVLFSVKNELVLTLNLQQMTFDLTHTVPVCKRRTVVDSSMVFDVTTYNSNLNYHDTVLKTTVVTMQVAYDAVACDMPALDINMHVSGLAVEVNACLLQLFKQLKHVSSMLSSEHMGIKMKHERMVRLYNELDVDVSMISTKVDYRETIDLMQLPTERYTQVPDKEIYLFIKDRTVEGSNNHVFNLLSGQFEAVSSTSSRKPGSEWIVREGKNLLFGNSNNVKSLLHMLNGQGDSADVEVNMEEIFKSDRSLLLLGKYHMEQTCSRLFKVPNSCGLVLMEQYLSDDMKPYVILSSCIRIQNSTDIPLDINIDSKLGYFTKVAYKLTQHAKPKEHLKKMHIEPYTSSSVPLSWFGTGMMPTIGPVFDKDEGTGDAVPFQYLHNLLNMNQLTVSDFDGVSEFALKFRGFLALKCSVLVKEAASTDECGSYFYHFTIKIEPMVKLCNILPCDVYVALALNRAKLNDDGRIEMSDRAVQVNSYKVQRRLKSGETMGIPFSEQKLYMRVSVFGTQMDSNTSESKTVIEDFEYVSPVFQIYLPAVGTASIVKTLRIFKGSVTALLYNNIDRHANAFQAFEDQLKSMTITMDLSRHDIRVWWPFMFENMSSTSLIINGCLLDPMARFYGNLTDASNCRIRALMYTNGHGEPGKQTMYSMSQCVKLDITSTTDFRPPINLIVPLQKHCMTQVNLSETTVNVDGVLESIANTSHHLRHARRYLEHDSINNEEQSTVNEGPDDDMDKATDLDASSSGNLFICLGSTVRYAEYPYNTCKIVSVTNLYTFVNRLPFTICVRGAPDVSQCIENGSAEVASDVVILPGESGALNSPFQGAYIIKVENDICSGIFSLQYSRLPYVFQLELNSNNITYSTVATRGLLVQVNVISGVFEGSKMPYSYNGYYFVLSFPHKPQYQILNLTKYTLAYTVPENMNTTESQLVDTYESYEPTWQKAPMNKIGILPSTCITHYVPVANVKSQEMLQVCLKVLHVAACEWHIQQVDFVREGYHVMKFLHEGDNSFLYVTIMIRSNGTRIIAVVDSKPAAIELNRLGGATMSMVPKLQWSNISFSFLTPRITVTLSTKRKVIMALHLTNAALGVSITPSKSLQVDRDNKDMGDVESSKGNIIEFDGVIQSIHIDHFVQGYIPVILKSSAKRSNLQDSFLHLRVASSNFMALGLPVYDLIHVKLSPLSINIEICVIEQLIESIESMLKLPNSNAAVETKGSTGTNPLVVPQPKWVEMEPAPPVYIRRLTVDPINLILSIRTSSLQLAHQTMRILDALPLDTPCVCVHFAKEERSYLIVGWCQLMHSLRNSYLRQLIRQSLPSAWLSNSFAMLHGLGKGLVFLIMQPVQNAVRFKNVVEGFALGICNGIMLFTLYIAGGTAQSLGHFLNIFHKIIGGHRSKPQGILDAIWLGMNVLFLHVLYRPWKRLIGDFSNSHSRGDGVFKTSLGLVLNLTRCAVSPVIGVVNMVITIVEGFSNVLLGDFEQFTHVYESDQLEKAPSANTRFGEKKQDVKEISLSQNTFVRRMKTSIALRRKINWDL